MRAFFKIAFFAGLVVVLSCGVLWLWGRAPTAYVMEAECRRFQEDRRRIDAELGDAIARREADLLQGGVPAADLEKLRRRRVELYRATRAEDVRGWRVLIIPATAERPDPADYLVAGTWNPTGPLDPPQLRGAMDVWLAPRNWLARALHGLGLSP